MYKSGILHVFVCQNTDLFLDSIFHPDYAGKVKVCELRYPGSVAKVALQLPQTFHRVQCESHLQLPQARWTYFIEKVGACGRLKKQS